MKKGWALFAVLFASSAIGAAAQTQMLGKQDVLDAFKRYNPAALEKAALNEQYADLLNKLAASYSAARTEKNQLEMIALVKNFDNSILLQGVKNRYAQGRTLQLVSGTDLASLERDTRAEILALVEDIYKNTIEVKEIQLENYKTQRKAIKKSKVLSRDEKKRIVAVFDQQIKDVKEEMKSFKQDHRQKIQDTADVYFAEIRSNYEASVAAASAQSLKAEQAENLSVTDKNKKPVAK
ncbi:MAG: hypothetical protein IKC13_07090 [Elusimicrobiaceae bacterium]|nr:hypothetical protein [Elusimicrobiaceae bacterium]